MERVIEWIAGHIGMVMVLGIAALSLLGKMKINIGNPAGERPMRPTRPMPSFGGGPGEIRAPEPPRKEPDREWVSGEGVTMEGVVREPAPARTARTLAPSGLPVASRIKEAGMLEPIATAPSALAHAPGKDDLARAVIWAEVLGPPRAKRPYGRR